MCDVQLWIFMHLANQNNSSNLKNCGFDTSGQIVDTRLIKWKPEFR
jgi:hypothetical protein